MKKLIPVLALVLLLVMTLAACNNTVATEKIARWTNGEHYVYDIYKAELGLSKTYDDETYINEPIVSNYEYKPESLDQIVPENIAGTYTVDIELINGGERCRYTTKQVLYVRYKNYDVRDLDIWKNGELQQYKVDDTENPFGAGGDFVTLKSTTDTAVEFKNDASQRPLKSENHVNGFYLGKIHSEISKYDVATVYNWDDKKAEVTYNGETRKSDLNVNANIIDSNQLLLYVRSLEKKADKFQDNPTVQVYMPVDNTFANVSFVFGYKCNTMMRTRYDTQTNYVRLNSVGILANGTALMIQLNLPENVSLDSGSFDGEKRSKYTTVRFRTGYIAYQLSLNTPNYADIVDAVTVKPKAEKDK